MGIIKENRHIAEKIVVSVLIIFIGGVLGFITASTGDFLLAMVFSGLMFPVCYITFVYELMRVFCHDSRKLFLGWEILLSLSILVSLLILAYILMMTLVGGTGFLLVYLLISIINIGLTLLIMRQKPAN